MTQSLLSSAEISSLQRSVKRADRPHRFRAVALALPAIVFLMLTFAAPIGYFLLASVKNPEVQETLPQTLVALAAWDGKTTPPETVFAAFASDLSQAKRTNTAAMLGKRLNYEIPGMRSRIMSLTRNIDQLAPGPVAAQVIAADPAWANPGTWRVVQRNGGSLTPYYLLTAIDLERNDQNTLTRTATDQAVFIDILGRTLWIAGLVTLTTLALGFPTAYIISIAPARVAAFMTLLVLLPLWTSLLVRTTAWVVLLQTDGIINQILMALHITTDKLQLMLTRFGTIAAMTHIQLPFTLLPILAVMKTIQPAQMRAARSLGAPPISAFWRIYAPQTLPGVAAGCLMTFILSLGYYITPALVGGPRDQMLSNLIATYINRDLNWGMAAALACLLLFVTLSIYFIFLRLVGADRIRLG